MSKTLLWLAALPFINAARGQTGLAGPIQGFIFDAPTRTVRALTGSLGAASFGPALMDRLDFATIAPHQNYGIAFRRGQVLVMSSLDSSLSTEMLPASSAVPDHAAWADDGSVVILYSQSANWIQIYRGFPGRVTVGSQLPMPGALSAITADAHGQWVAVGITGEQGGVYLLGADQSFSQLLHSSAPISLAFSADRNTLYALDQVTNQVFEMTLSNSSVQTWPAGADDAIAIRESTGATGERLIYVAARSSHLLLSVDKSTHETIASAILSFAPDVIEPIGNNGFLLTRRSRSNDILWTFTDGAQPAIYFVPAISSQPLHREVPRR